MDIPDCLTCGACCTRTAWGAGPFVMLFGDEPDRFPVENLSPCGEFLGTTEAGPCVFLTGAVGTRVGCTRYADRPQTCRDFEAGTPECLGARSKVLTRASGTDAPSSPRPPCTSPPSTP